jgi:phage terminase Nu1 subunit (DNA packaging protein)
MRLSGSELAQAYQVSANTITARVRRECPRISAGGPGARSVFDWKAVAAWVAMYKNWPGYSDPDEWIYSAFQRARAILSARKKRKTNQG